MIYSLVLFLDMDKSIYLDLLSSFLGHTIQYYKTQFPHCNDRNYSDGAIQIHVDELLHPIGKKEKP